MDETSVLGIAQTDIKKGQRVEHDTRTGAVRLAEESVDKLAKESLIHARLRRAAAPIADVEDPKVMIYRGDGVESYYLVEVVLVHDLKKALYSSRP